MKSSWITSFGALLAASGIVNAGEVIATVDEVWQLTSSTEPVSCEAFGFEASHVDGFSNPALFIGPLVPLFAIPTYVEVSDQNSVLFTPFVERLTDGQNGTLSFAPKVLCDGVTALFPQEPLTEYEFFGGSSDLALFDIEAIRVRYMSADFDLSGHLSGEASVRFEFIGSPIPEPAAVAILAMGVLPLIAGSNRKRR